MPFFTWRNFPSIYGISLEKRKIRWLGLAILSLRDHLAGVSLCWDEGGCTLLFLCAAIMGLHSPISVAFQEPFMKSMIKCKWWFHQKRHKALEMELEIGSLLCSVLLDLWVYSRAKLSLIHISRSFGFAFPSSSLPLSHSWLFLWSFSSHWLEKLSL